LIQKGDALAGEAGQPLEREVFANLLRARDQLAGGLSALLGPSGVSAPQLNVLRILRGGGDEGLPCQRIAERMIARVPDVTRLLDRLEAAGLVRRERGTQDRRVVTVRIRERGEALLAALDRPLLRWHVEQFDCLSSEELTELNRLLAKILQGAAA
jgi:DNA-binding MarR family transcriptional regulator